MKSESTYIITTIRQGIDYDDFYTSAELTKAEAHEEWEKICKESEKRVIGNGYIGQIIAANCTEITADGKCYTAGDIAAIGGGFVQPDKKIFEIAKRNKNN